MKPTPPMPTLDGLIALYETRGAAQYGAEAVNQLEHALQCAAQAESAGATPALITACLLHDVGHLVHRLGEHHLNDGVDDAHEYIAATYLRRLFPATVLEPIRLHVDAKRYLCATESGYWENLSPASKRSLELQGGIYPPAQAEAFLRQPHAEDAVNLRRWDDGAKVKGKQTPPLSHFAACMGACSLVLETEPLSRFA